MFLPNRIRVEILLPLIDNEGNDIDKSKFIKAGKKLQKEFGGYTLNQAQGVWFDEKRKRHGDVNAGFYVVVPHTDKNIEFFKKYKKTLMKSFSDQKEIFITYYPVETL